MAALSLNEAIRRIIDGVEAASSKETMELLGETAVDLIRRRTQLGYGVSQTGGPRQRLKKLSDVYIEYRKGNRARLSPLTTVRRSNLTFTGQMLRALGTISAQQAKTEIATIGTRDDGLRNEDVAQWVTEKGRPWLNLSKPELAQLLRVYSRGLSSVLASRLGRG